MLAAGAPVALELASEGSTGALTGTPATVLLLDPEACAGTPQRPLGRPRRFLLPRAEPTRPLVTAGHGAANRPGCRTRLRGRGIASLPVIQWLSYKAPGRVEGPNPEKFLPQNSEPWGNSLKAFIKCFFLKK